MSGAAPSRRIAVSPTVSDFEIAAAQAIVAAIEDAMEVRGGCLIALSGGRTPCGVYRRLGDWLATRPLDSSRLHLVVVDERMVPPDDPDSNFGMILRELVSRISIPPLNVHRIRGEERAEVAARDYELELAAVLPRFAGRCDLVTLGIGQDGHTASLFPGTPVLRESRRSAREVFVPQLASWRVTLTLLCINRARAVLFLATGERKAAVVGEVLSSDRTREELPATMVRPESGMTTWMLDAEAASRIPVELAR